MATMTVGQTRMIAELRAYARALCRNNIEADKLVKETLQNALETSLRGPSDSRMRTLLFRMMRNRYYGTIVAKPGIIPEAEDYSICLYQELVDGFIGAEQKEIAQAIKTLPIHFREALVLMSIVGESRQAAAEIMECDLGTADNRLARARNMLQVLLRYSA